MAPGTDIGRAFFRLPEDERQTVLRWAEALGAEPEDVPPLRSLIEAVAACRIADGVTGPRERGWNEAGRILGIEEPDTVRRRVDYWRARRSGKNLRESVAGGE